MANVLNADQRNYLDGTIQQARVAAEKGAADALLALAVAHKDRPAYLSGPDNELRKALREKARQLGDDTAPKVADLTNLVRDVAYEQWHRMLFARFLEENGLLRPPRSATRPLTPRRLRRPRRRRGRARRLVGWPPASPPRCCPASSGSTTRPSRCASPPKHRHALERILAALPSEVFATEDALGWVYQFWQTAEKKRGQRLRRQDRWRRPRPGHPVLHRALHGPVPAGELPGRLVGGPPPRVPADRLLGLPAPPRRRHPGRRHLRRMAGHRRRGHRHGPLLRLRALPGRHAFGMLWRMRAEEEGLSRPRRRTRCCGDNLHGLELDPRCTQIATFNVALEAWKQGGFRDLPAPRIACSGVPVRAARAEWEDYAGADQELRSVLGRLHSLFRSADTLGSLITPRPTDLGGVLFGPDLNTGTAWESIRDALHHVLDAQQEDTSVLGHAADDVVHAASLLSDSYTLVATNPPYLKRASMDAELQDYIDAHHPRAKGDIATAFIERALDFVGQPGQWPWSPRRTGRC